MSADDESKVEWETPERNRAPVSGWFVAAILAGAFIVFTFFCVGAWAQLQERQRHLNPAGPSMPQVLGKAEINIVNSGLIQLDTRAYDEQNAQRERLHGYGWVDVDAGMAHVPIEWGIQRVVTEQHRRDGGVP